MDLLGDKGTRLTRPARCHSKPKEQCDDSKHCSNEKGTDGSISDHCDCQCDQDEVSDEESSVNWAWPCKTGAVLDEMSAETRNSQRGSDHNQVSDSTNSSSRW